MKMKHTILIVDDDDEFRKTLSHTLTFKGYAPIAVENGETALATIEIEKPSVALIDLRLEDMSGLALLKDIKERLPSTECILLTGYASQDSAIEAVNLGAYGYLQKPYELDQLFCILYQAIEKWKTEAALRKSEERFRQVVASISDQIYVAEITEDGHCINSYYSPGITTLTGYPLEKLKIDQCFWSWEIVHPDDRANVVSQGAQLASGQNSEVEYRLVRADGQVIWVRDSARVESKGASKIVYGVISDITERIQTEKALRAYAERLKVLREIDQAIQEAHSAEAMAQAALQRIQQLVPYCQASVNLIDFETGMINVLAVQVKGESKVDFIPSIPIKSTQLWESLKLGDPIRLDNLEDYTDQLEVQSLQADGVGSYLLIPLIAQGELIGGLGLGVQAPGIFNSEHTEIAQEIARLLAVSIQQVRLHEQVHRHAAELEQRVVELQQIQAAEREQRKLAETLREVTSVLNTSLDREQVLRIILEQFSRVVDYDGASVTLIVDDALELVATRNSRPKRRAYTPLSIKALPHVQEVLKYRTPVIIPDTTVDPRWLRVPGSNHIRSWLGVPMVVQDRVVGLLNLNKEQPGFYTNREAELALIMANQAAIAVENAQLFEQSQQEINERVRAEAALEEERASLTRRVAERTSELSAVNAELARAARLKDEFLASMSHELRTPLNAILGLSEALQEEVYGPLNEKQCKSLITIEESGRHLLSLINDILDVSKIEAGKLTLEIGPVSIEAVCQASLRLIKQTAYKKQLKVSAAFDSTVTMIQADERRLKQILVNLLSNAVKFTPTGGEIGLEVTGNAAEQVAHFIVWDTGIGIPPEETDRLFKPFVQLDSSLSRRHQGTGLGLALVGRLTELHGGGVSVESEVNKGSRFTISLPWSESVEAANRVEETRQYSRPSTSASHHLNPPLILLVEDNEHNINTISAYLLAKGYRIVVARNGVEAISQAKEAEPDLILMDIQMPEMDGLEAMRRLRANPDLETIPIIALTALTMPGDRERCLAAGADDYLDKPVSLKTLVELVEAQLR